jgi:hypothetical protein
MTEADDPVPPPIAAAPAVGATTQKARKREKILFVAMILAPVVAVGGCIACLVVQEELNALAVREVGERSFDSVEWKRLREPSSRMERAVRYSMATDLFRNRTLIGLTWDSALELLGPPDPGMSFSCDGYCAYCYHTGVPLNSHASFVVSVDREGLVCRSDFKDVSSDGVMVSP